MGCQWGLESLVADRSRLSSVVPAAGLFAAQLSLVLLELLARELTVATAYGGEVSKGHQREGFEEKGYQAGARVGGPRSAVLSQSTSRMWKITLHAAA